MVQGDVDRSNLLAQLLHNVCLVKDDNSTVRVDVQQVVIGEEDDVCRLVQLPGHVLGAEVVLLPKLVEIFNVHDLIIPELRPLIELLHVLVEGADLGLDPGLAHVQLLPAVWGLHHSRVHTELDPKMDTLL